MAGRVPPRISSITFYKHRFKRALQLFSKSGGDPIEAFAKFKKQVAATNLKLAKSSAMFVIVAAAFIASLSTGSLSIKTSLVSFSIPSVYLLFLSSLLWVGFCFSLISAIQMIAFSNAYKFYFGRFKNDYEMLVFLKDVEIDDFLAPPYYDSFLEPSKIAFYFRSLMFLIIICAGQLPVAAAQSAVVSHAFETAIAQDSVPLHKSLAYAAITLISASTVYLISAFVPFKNTKQTELIRWVFLSRLHRETSENFHPRSHYWLAEDDNK